jgi:NADP-dependent aldehyde dehydrogenase
MSQSRGDGGGRVGSVHSFDPRTGRVNGTVEETTADQVATAVRAAVQAAGAVAAASPAVRRDWLYAVADALAAQLQTLVNLADRETALGVVRLTGEVERATAQLRFYGDVASEGSYLGATIDSPTDRRPSLARVNHPLGPVAVFGASNFPFAFSVLGNDTGAAIAAGCPVVVKAHPAHPLLSQRLAELARQALIAAGAPDATLQLVTGTQPGVDLVRADGIAAVAFTGSQSGGLALWRAANERAVVIPVYAEMGTVNPVVVTPSGAERISAIAAGFVGSYTLGAGQFCTKPGLMFAPAGSQAALEVAKALRATPSATHLLTRAIAQSVRDTLPRLESAGATLVDVIEGPDGGWSAPSAVLEAPITALRKGSDLLEECFGPVALVVEYTDETELRDALAQMQGSLAATVMTSSDDHDPDAASIVALLAPKVGRVTVDDWPTGVAFSWAQQHGGPWPATSAPWATSVGAAALDRFVRPVTYQSAPSAWLPRALQDDNPWRIPRRLDGVMQRPGDSP